MLHDLNKLRTQNLLKLYSIDSTKTNTLEKAEGSRGGKVIGHTSKGNPIYDTANHESHKNFTTHEHIEAENKHTKAYEEISHKHFNNLVKDEKGVGPMEHYGQHSWGDIPYEKRGEILRKHQELLSKDKEYQHHEGEAKKHSQMFSEAYKKQKEEESKKPKQKEPKTHIVQSGGELPKELSKHLSPEIREKLNKKIESTRGRGLNTLEKTISKHLKDVGQHVEVGEGGDDHMVFHHHGPLHKSDKIKKSEPSDLQKAFATLIGPGEEDVDYTEQVFEKGGIGSGRKIGTTKSGKDIYDKFDHPAHKDFTSKDHEDAADLHESKSDFHKTESSKYDRDEDELRPEHERLVEHHDIQNASHEHMASVKRMKEKNSGYSSVGSQIKKSETNHEINHPRKQSLETPIQNYQQLQKAKLLESYSKNEVIEKAEGSRGGKVIGHTKSGKAIYENANHESHKDFSIEEHNDAIEVHQKVRDDYFHNSKSTDKDKEDNDKAFEQQKHHIAAKNQLIKD